MTDKIENGKVICQECGKRLKIITPSHLKKDGLTIDQYREKYPDAPLSADEFSALRKYGSNKNDMFKKEDDSEKDFEEIFNEELENSLEEEYKVEENYDREDYIENEFEGRFKNTVFQSNQKKNVLKTLFSFHRNIQPDYFVEIFAFGNSLQHKFVTDFAIPDEKIAIFCPDVFWHNSEDPTHPDKYNILKENGWTVIEIRGKDPLVDLYSVVKHLEK